MKTDYHIHTEFSDDSEYPVEQVIKDSIKMDLDEICFTDHVDYGIKKDWDEPGEMIYRKGGPGEPRKNIMNAIMRICYILFRTITITAF